MSQHDAVPPRMSSRDENSASDSPTHTLGRARGSNKDQRGLLKSTDTSRYRNLRRDPARGRNGERSAGSSGGGGASSGTDREPINSPPSTRPRRRRLSDDERQREQHRDPDRRTPPNNATSSSHNIAERRSPRRQTNELGDSSRPQASARAPRYPDDQRPAASQRAVDRYGPSSYTDREREREDEWRRDRDRERSRDYDNRQHQRPDVSAQKTTVTPSYPRDYESKGKEFDTSSRQGSIMSTTPSDASPPPPPPNLPIDETKNLFRKLIPENDISGNTSKLTAPLTPSKDDFRMSKLLPTSLRKNKATAETSPTLKLSIPTSRNNKDSDKIDDKQYQRASNELKIPPTDKYGLSTKISNAALSPTSSKPYNSRTVERELTSNTRGAPLKNIDLLKPLPLDPRAQQVDESSSNTNLRNREPELGKKSRHSPDRWLERDRDQDITSSRINGIKRVGNSSRPASVQSDRTAPDSPTTTKIPGLPTNKSDDGLARNRYPESSSTRDRVAAPPVSTSANTHSANYSKRQDNNSRKPREYDSGQAEDRRRDIDDNEDTRILGRSRANIPDDQNYNRNTERERNPSEFGKSSLQSMRSQLDQSEGGYRSNWESSTSHGNGQASGENTQERNPKSLLRNGRESGVTGISQPTSRDYAPSERSDLIGSKSRRPAVDVTSDLLTEYLIQQCLVDTRNYRIHTKEDVDRMKNDTRKLQSITKSLTGKIAVEAKVRDAALSLQKLHANDRQLSRQAELQVNASTEKVCGFTTELLKVTLRSVEVERRLLRHSAAVLGSAYQRSEQEFETFKRDGTTPSGSVTEEKRLQARMLALDAKCQALSNELEASQRLQKQTQSTLESRSQVATTMTAQVEGIKTRLDEEQDVILQKDRDIATLRTELEQTTSKLDFLEAKQASRDKDRLGIGQQGGSKRDRFRDFTSDSGIEPLDDGLTELSDVKTESSDTLRAIVLKLKDQLSRANTKIAALEGQLSPSESGPNGGNTNALNSRSATNASLREAILEREKAKSDLENERERRRDAEKTNSDTQEELLRLRRELRQKNDQSSEGVSPGGTDSRQKIRELQRQLHDVTDDLNEQKQKHKNHLMSLEELSAKLTNSRGTSSPSGRLDAPDMIFKVTRLISSKDELLDDVKKLKTKNETLEDKIDQLTKELNNNRAIAKDEKESTQALHNLARSEDSLAKALDDLQRIKVENRQLHDNLDNATSVRDRSNKDLERLREEYEQLRETQSKSRQETDQTRSVETQLRSEHRREVQILQDKLDLTKKDLEEMYSDYRESQRNMAQLKEKNEQLNLQVDTLKDDYEGTMRNLRASLEKSGQESNKELLQGKVRLEETEYALREKEVQLKEADANLRQLEDDNDQLKRENNATKQRLIAAEDAQRDEKIKRQTVEERVHGLEDLDKELRDVKDLYEKAIATQASSRRDFEDQIERIQTTSNKDIRALEDELSTAKAKVHTLRNDLDDVERKKREEEDIFKQQLEDATQSLKQQLKAKEQSLNDKSMSINEMTSALKAAEDKHVKEMHELEERFNLPLQQLTDELHNQVTTQQADAQAKQQRIRSMEEELRDLQERYTEDTSAYERELNNIQSQYDKQESQMDAMKRLTKQNEADEQDLRDQLSLLSAQRSSERTEYERCIEEMQSQIGDTAGVDVTAHEQLKEQMQAMEIQLDQTVEKFRRREGALSDEVEKLLMSESRLQEELNGILKEFDRLTMTFTDFDSERRKLERVIAKQRDEMDVLRNKAEGLQVDRLGGNDKNPTVVNLRKEFRKILSDVREEYQQTLNHELNDKMVLEKTLREQKREREMESYNKTTSATQTSVLYVES